MTEPINTETTQTNEPEQTYTKEQMESLRSNIGAEAAKYKDELSELRQQLEARTNADAEAERKQLEEQGKIKELLEQERGTFATEKEADQKRIADLRSELDNTKQDAALAIAGVKDEIRIEGLKAIYTRTPEAGTFAEFLQTQNITPDRAPGKPSGAVGTVPQGGDAQVYVPTSHEEARGMTREQKAQAREAIRNQGRGIVG